MIISPSPASPKYLPKPDLNPAPLPKNGIDALSLLDMEAAVGDIGSWCQSNPVRRERGAVGVYGHKQPGLGVSLHVCPPTNQHAMGADT